MITNNLKNHYSSHYNTIFVLSCIKFSKNKNEKFWTWKINFFDLYMQWFIHALSTRLLQHTMHGIPYYLQISLGIKATKVRTDILCLYTLSSKYFSCFSFSPQMTLNDPKQTFQALPKAATAKHNINIMNMLLQPLILSQIFVKSLLLGTGLTQPGNSRKIGQINKNKV